MLIATKSERPEEIKAACISPLLKGQLNWKYRPDACDKRSLKRGAWGFTEKIANTQVTSSMVTSKVIKSTKAFRALRVMPASIANGMHKKTTDLLKKFDKQEWGVSQ